MSYINQRKYLGAKFKGIYKPIAVTYDADAQAYFNVNTAITSTADKNAINDFYLGIKTDGIYTKIKVMNLPIWGSASTCKWNLVNPLDTDTAFRAVYSTGFTYSSGGIQGNGTSAYIDIFFVPSAVVSQNSFSFGFYCRTNRAGSNSIHSMGITQSTPNANSNMRLKLTTDISVYYCNDTSGVNFSTTDTRGFFQCSRINSTQIFYGKNTYNTGAFLSTGINNIKFPIFARNNAGTITGYETTQSSFFYLANGLTLVEMANFRTRVNTLMTYFGINV